MRDRRRTTAAMAAFAAALLWQVTGEIGTAVANAGGSPAWLLGLPVGTPFSVTVVPSLVPDAGLWVAGILLTLAVVAGVVGTGVALVLRDRPSRPVVALSTWMVVVLAGVLGQIAAGPMLVGYQSMPMSVVASIYRGAGWGVMVGSLVVVLVVVRASRPAGRSPSVDRVGAPENSVPAREDRYGDTHA